MAALVRGDRAGPSVRSRRGGRPGSIRSGSASIEALARRLEAAIARLESLETELNPARRGSNPDPGADNGSLRAGPVLLDGAARRAYLGDRDLGLSPMEYRVLRELAREAGRVVTHRDLLRRAWGPGYAGETHYVKVYANRLRAKLEAVGPAGGCSIETIWGIGYRIVVES